MSVDKLARNQIGFMPADRKPEEKPPFEQRPSLLERRVQALENNDGNYQVYLKMKEKFEG